MKVVAETPALLTICYVMHPVRLDEADWIMVSNLKKKMIGNVGNELRQNDNL